MNTTEAKTFLTRPARLEQQRDRMKDKLEEILQNITGITAANYTERSGKTGTHDAQERKIIKYMETTERLENSILKTDLEAMEASFAIVQTLEDLAGDISAETFNFILRRYIQNKNTRGISTTEGKVLADFARAYTETKEGGAV